MLAGGPLTCSPLSGRAAARKMPQGEPPGRSGPECSYRRSGGSAGYGGSGSGEATGAPYFGSQGRQGPAQYSAQAWALTLALCRLTDGLACR